MNQIYGGIGLGQQAQMVQMQEAKKAATERVPTIAEAIDRALAQGEQQRVRLMKLRVIIENMDMLDKPVHDLHNLFMF